MVTFDRRGEEFKKTTIDLPLRLWVALDMVHGRKKSEFIVKLVEGALSNIEVDDGNGTYRKIGDLVDEERERDNTKTKLVMETAFNVPTPEEAIEKAIGEIEWVSEGLREVGVTPEIVGAVMYQTGLYGVSVSKQKINGYLRKRVRENE
jgi:hypothetical protein